MSDVFLDELKLPAPTQQFGVGSDTHARQTAQVMIKLEEFMLTERPHVVLVAGDVNSTLGAALAAVKLNVPVGHVEAGLRSFDRTMPEEVNRVVTDVVSDLLFAPSADAVTNLKAEGISADKIHLVGNVMIDTLDALREATRRSTVLGRLGLTEGKYLLGTFHRPSNVDSKESLSRLMTVLRAAAEELPLVLVAHPRTKLKLAEFGVVPPEARIRIIDPLGYIDFVRLMSDAAAVLTDSGGIQEETTVLGVPCLTLRETTERPITVTEGTNQIVGLNQSVIEAAIHKIVSGDKPPSMRPPLWDGRAASRIADILERGFVASSP
jgi:UDP-N-acetylglucosamine 2-epimerase (non-hydrolysing)